MTLAEVKEMNEFVAGELTQEILGMVEEHRSQEVYPRILLRITEACNEGLERAAQEAEQLYDKTYWDDPSAGIAAAIRRLKSE